MKDAKIIEFLNDNNFSKVIEKIYIYFSLIKKLVLKNNGSKQETEDIYQEALIKLIKKIQTDNFILTNSLNTYLYSIYRFLLSDQLKKKNKIIEVDIEKNKLYLKADEFGNLSRGEYETKLAEKAFDLLGA